MKHIRTQVTVMDWFVEQQLTDAISAMHNQDEELARRVIAGDARVNMIEDTHTIPSVLTALF